MNRKVATVISLAVSISLLALGIWFIYNRHSPLWQGGWGPHMGHGALMGGGLGLVMPLFWVIVCIGIVLWATIILGNSSKASNPTDSLDALNILKQRYASGEIDKAEYEAKRRDLREP